MPESRNPKNGVSIASLQLGPNGQSATGQDFECYVVLAENVSGIPDDKAPTDYYFTIITVISPPSPLV